MKPRRRIRKRSLLAASLFGPLAMVGAKAQTASPNSALATSSKGVEAASAAIPGLRITARGKGGAEIQTWESEARIQLGTHRMTVKNHWLYLGREALAQLPPEARELVITSADGRIRVETDGEPLVERKF